MERLGTTITLAAEVEHGRVHRDMARELRADATRARSRSDELRHNMLALAFRYNVRTGGMQSDGVRPAPAPTPATPTGEARLTAEVDQVQAEVAHLRAALASRDVIWEAKLIIAAATGCDAPEAQQLLVRQSQHENRKLREIAQEIVRRGRA